MIWSENFDTPFSKTSLKQDRFGGERMDGITVEEEAVNMSQILLIFLFKNLVCQGFF